MHFNDKVVLITGASSGIGASCALLFAKSCAKLSLIGRNEDNLRGVAESCEQISGLKPHYIIADITNDEDVEIIVKDTIRHYGGIDVLINNAGLSVTAVVHDDITVYDRIMATNVRGTYFLTRKVIPYLKKSKGCIVNISSILSTRPLPIMMPYCMSKAAIDVFTKCIALELAPSGVRVNSVSPGPVKTELFKRSGMSAEETDKMFEGLEVVTPLKKVTKGENVAELVIFLASEKANCITGSCYVIDCGLTLCDSGNCN